MNMYSIVTQQDYDELLAFGNANYGCAGCTLKIGGQQESNGTWFVYTPDAVPPYSSAISTSGVSCLQFTNNVPSKLRGPSCLNYEDCIRGFV